MQPYSLLFLLPGIGLILVSLYIPISYLHKQISWTETEATIVDRVERNAGGEAEVLYMMEYVDERGLVHQATIDSEIHFSEGTSSSRAPLLYNPSDPTKYEFVNPGRYLLILFFPLGLLLAYFGKPKW